MNKVILSAGLLLAFAPLSRAADAPVKMETRMYRDVERVRDGCLESGGKRRSADPVEYRTSKASSALRKHLENHGITFSGEAYVFYDPSWSALVMRNTPAQHAKARRLLALWGCPPGQIALDAAVVAFPKTEIATTAQKRAAAVPSSDDLIALWKGGKGHLVAHHTVITRSGVNAQMQSITEINLPTQLVPSHWREGGDRNVVLCSSPPLDRSKSFDTREAGLLVNFTPTLRPGSTLVDLVVAAEICLATATNAFDASFGPTGSVSRIHIDQPLFQAGRTTTTLVLRDGATAVMSDLNVPAGTEGWYLFLTARVLDSACAPLGDSDFSILLDDEPAVP